MAENDIPIIERLTDATMPYRNWFLGGSIVALAVSLFALAMAYNS